MENEKHELNVIGEWKQPEMVKVSILTIDDGDGATQYQRSVRLSFPLWDWGLYDPIRVGHRKADGTRHVIEGGRRTREARRFGIGELPAIVRESDGCQHEAETFIAVARARKGLSAMDRHRAGVIAGDKRACDVSAVTEKHGFSIRNSDEWPSIRVVTALYKQSVESLDFALGIIKEIWNGDTDALREPIIIGLAKWYTDTESPSRDRLIKRLATKSPRFILQQSSGLPAGVEHRAAYAAVFENLYKKRK